MKRQLSNGDVLHHDDGDNINRQRRVRAGAQRKRRGSKRKARLLKRARADGRRQRANRRRVLLAEVKNIYESVKPKAIAGFVQNLEFAQK